MMRTRNRTSVTWAAACLSLATVSLAAGGRSAAATFVTGEDVKLIASDDSNGDLFGRSLSIDGNTMVVGANGDDNFNGGGAGSAYIFERDADGNWIQVKKLVGSDTASDDRFGRAVWISGDTVAVGAPLNDTTVAPDAGAVYVFERDEGGANFWGEVTKVVAADGELGDEFGNDLALDGDTLVVGVRFDNDAGTAAGSAYVFSRDTGGAGNWGQVKKLLASDGAMNDLFGRTVGVSGDVIVVGAPLHASSLGAAYLFERDAGGADNWGETKKLAASDGLASDEFGDDVGVSGDTVAVGARGDDGNTGAAYVFERNQGGADNWGEVKKIVATDAAPGDVFGWAISIAGDELIVGARLKDGATGAAYLCARDEGGADNWGEVAKLEASDGAAKEEFGVSVEIAGDLVAVGARFDDDACPGDPNCDSGSSYVFPWILFGDNFDDGALTAEWSFPRGTWSEAGGSMHGVPDDVIGTQTKARAIADPAFGGCDVCGAEAQLELSNITPDALPAEVHVRLLAWYVTNQTNVAVSLKTEQDKIVIRQKQDTVALDRHSVDRALDPDTVYTVRVEFDGTDFRVFLDGELIDTTPNLFSGTPFGTIGTQSRDADIDVHDVKTFH